MKYKKDSFMEDLKINRAQEKISKIFIWIKRKNQSLIRLRQPQPHLSEFH